MGLLGALWSCSGGPTGKCLALLEEEDQETAVTVCESAFAATGDSQAGLAAARARLAVGDADEALAWIEELDGSRQGAEASELAATIYQRQGENERAFAAYERAGRLYRDRGDERNAWRTAYTLFYLAWEQARYQDAFRWVRQSYEDAEQVAARSLEAASLGGLATVLFEVGDLSGTARVVHAGLAATPPDEATNRARLLMLEGLVHLRSARPALARQTFGDALAAAGSGAEPRFYRSGYLNQVEADLALDDRKAARTHLDAARRLDGEGSALLAMDFYDARLLERDERFGEAVALLDAALARDPDAGWRWTLLNLRGRAYERLGRWVEAEGDYQAATAVLEDLRRDLGFDELKTWLQDERREPFEALVRLELEHRGATKALETVERAKARTLVDALVGEVVTAPSDESSDVFATSVDRASALTELLPALTSSAAVEVPPLGEILHGYERRNVLEYFQAGDAVWLFTVTGDELRSHRLALPARETARLARRFRATPGDGALAEQLGSVLLPPGVVPPTGSRLEIVTDGVLGLVPFAALRREGRALVQDHAITYIPSLSAGVLLRRGRKATGNSIEVLGDPQGDLPGAAQEVRQVAAALHAEALVGPAAVLASLEPAASVRLLHLATHTGVGPRGPWLALADGRVDAAAILSGRLGGDLVVLASCASAAREGKGLWGSLGAAFLAGGAQAVIASLWSVEDRAAARLVWQLYEGGGIADPAVALARAQRRLMAAGEPATVWAAFVVFGSNEPLQLN